MATSPRPPAAPAAAAGLAGGPHHASALDALQDFLVSSCAPHEPPHGRATPVVQLDVTPPPLHEEFSHELALGFLFADEMKVVRQLQLKYTQGQELFTKVYFARGCASAIPPAPPAASDATEVARLLRYYSGVYDVLQPQVAKLRMMCDYCTHTVGILSDTIQRIAAHENTHRVIPDMLLDSILDVMDIVLQMNQLHDAKSSLRNDFSLFKMAFKHVQGDVPDPESVGKEIQRLQEFVGGTAQSKNSIWDSLRRNLTSVKRYTHVMFLLVKQCVGHLESGRCLQPDERFKYIRLLPCLMAVLNVDPMHGNVSGFHHTEKKLIEATGRIVSRYPILPVFADLCVKPLEPVWELNLKTKADHTLLPDRSWDPAYDLCRVAEQARRDAADFIPRLMFSVNKMHRLGGKTKQDSLPASLAALVIEGVRYLTEWRTCMSLFLSSKYQRPKTDDQLEHIGVSLESPYLEYQRIFTHNFDHEECAAVTDITHTIKSVAQVLRRNAASIKPLVRGYLYSYLQEFVQHTLVAILHRAEKKKHASLKVLQDLRIMCGDWNREEAPVDDFKKRRRDRQLPGLKHRMIAPSRPQLQMMRTAVNAVYAKRTGGDLDPKMSIFAFHRELKSSDVTKLHEFYTRTADFGILLDFDQIVQDLCSFPEMLFREIFLEITKSPQLPADDSLPWLIWTRASLDGQRGVEFAPMLSLLEVYDDAVCFILARSEQSAVCHEIFAEAKLFFDNLIYSIANYVFTAAKSEAARSFLGSLCLQRLDAPNSTATHSTKVSSDTTVRNMRTLTALRQVKFLGECHDIMLLVSGHLNSRLMRDLTSSVSRLSRADATLYVAAADLVEVLRQAHKLLMEFFALDSFGGLWEEASTKPRLPSYKTDTVCMDNKRLQRVVSMAITRDLATHFGFNERTQRFYRTALPLELRSYVAKARTAEVDYGASSKDSGTSSSKKLLDGVGLDRDCRVGFEIAHQPYRSFVGVQHIKAMLSFLSPSDIVEVVDDCLELVTSQIEEVVHLFVPVLGSAIPPYRLPRLLYRTEGCYGYFESKFRHMMDSKELEAHVFHCLRIIGNALLTVHFVDQVTMTREQSMKAYAPSASYFISVLQRLHAFLVDTGLMNQWRADAQSTPEQADKSPSTFFLVWNGLEYLSCCSPRHGAASCDREMYGEGVSFAGCTLIHLLGQRSHYDMWNPSQYVIEAHEYDCVKNAAASTYQLAAIGKRESVPASPTSPQAVGTLDPEMIGHTKHFVTQATQMRRTHRHFFSLLENAWSAPVSSQTIRRTDFAAPT